MSRSTLSSTRRLAAASCSILLLGLIGSSPALAGGTERSRSSFTDFVRELRLRTPDQSGPEAFGDVDNDVVGDQVDNCPFVANTAQADADGDGLGDACDAYPTGGPLSFGAEILLPEPEAGRGDDHFTIDLAVDRTDPGGDRIYALIATSDFATFELRNLWLSRSDDGGASWSPPVKVNIFGDGSFWSTTGDLSVDDAGRVFISYDQPDGDIVLCKSLDGAFSVTCVRLGYGTGAGRRSAVAARSDRVYLVWEDDADSCTGIKQRRSVNGGESFGPTQTIRFAGACQPEIAIAPSDGRVLLSYWDESVPEHAAVAVSRNAGVSYGGSRSVRDVGRLSPVVLEFPLEIEEGVAGAAHVGWVERNGFEIGTQLTYYDYFADRSLDGGESFQADVALTGNIAHADPYLTPGRDQCDLVALSSGHVARALRDGIKDSTHIYYSISADLGASYSQPQPVKPPVHDMLEAVPLIERTRDDLLIIAYSRLSATEPAVPFLVRETPTGGIGVGTVGNTLTVSANRTTVNWGSARSATRYDVARGDLDELRLDGGFARTEGFSCGQAGTSVDDPSPPSPGTGLFYVVRGRGAAGLGTWGTAARDTGLLVCP